jgi:hypothetical protein
MTFDTFDGTVGTANGKRGAVSQNIPPMQGFWVKVNADGDTASVIFHNSDRVNIDPTLQNNRMRVPGSASILSGIIRLRVSNGINSDETILVTDAGALDAFDSFDSPKMKVNNPDIPEIYGMADSQEMELIISLISLPIKHLRWDSVWEKQATLISVRMKLLS